MRAVYHDGVEPVYCFIDFDERKIYYNGRPLYDPFDYWYPQLMRQAKQDLLEWLPDS